MPTPKQLNALVQFASANGRYWKACLRDAWFGGNYSDYYASEYASYLQQVRNELGPSWLVRFRLPK